uniref:Uncharacterized protein n=1 Tax=Aegilops tauschii subsp. strangulata TaxID=200361 RepID=A0A453KXQ0_AEGTS
GEASVLRQGGRQEGAVDAGGGPHARLLHPGARPRELARRADKHRADAVQQELPASVDQLPPAGDQARQLHRPGREAHRPPPGAPRQPLGGDSVLLAREDGQRHQELLEHPPQEEAQEDAGRRKPSQPAALAAPALPTPSPGSVTTYASSADNIARLLEGWMRPGSSSK